MYIRIFLVWLFSICFISLSAQNESFLKANNAYNSSDYKSAIDLYKVILDDGFESSDLYLNLGNAYLKSNNLGKAILSFEKGLKIDGDHNTLNQNLQYANKQIATQITLIPDFFVTRYWSNFVSIFSSTTWAILQIILFALLALAFGFWLLGKELRIKKIAFYSLFLIGLLLFISVLAGVKRTSEMKSSHRAIVMTSNTSLLSGASAQSELLLDISEGNKVKILDEIGEYYKVELIDKEVGWIVKKELEEI